MYLICVYFLETKSQLSLYHNNTILQVAMTEFVSQQRIILLQVMN